MTLWSNLILNKDLTIGTPEAFKVLICELQALCLDIGLFRYNTTNFTTFSLGKDKTNLPGDSSDLDSRPREATHAQSEKYNFIKGPQKSLTEMTSLMNFP
jgi:DNA-directed RNA polymerase subunit beta